MALKPLDELEVRQLVTAWYKDLDVHAPLVDLLPKVSDQGLEMRFPEATLHSVAEFEAWYGGVIRIFFDEVHALREVEISIPECGNRADIKLVVYWEASRWNPPAAHSERLLMDAYQTWVVERSETSGLPVVKTYTVDELRPLEGSVAL
jgi:hypothetical protein